MNPKIYEHDTEISPAIRYCQPCMNINLQNFVKKMGKYFGQQCQDDTLNQKFRELHGRLVNDIISFCKKNNIEAEEIILRVDGLKGSIPYEEWQPCTDSCLEMYKEDSRYELPILISL